jgi:hypothetical protein
MGFGGAAVMYFFSGASAWERYLVAVFPALVIAMFALAVLLDETKGDATAVADRRPSSDHLSLMTTELPMFSRQRSRVRG